jgi:hypothetical protein
MSAEPQTRDATTGEQATCAQRQQMALKITLYGEDPPPEGRPPDQRGGSDLWQRGVCGMGTSTSRWGTSAYSYSGELTWRREAGQIQGLSLDLDGRRVSGFDCGDVRFTLTQAGPGELAGEQFEFDCPATYRDDHNHKLAVRIRVSGVLAHGAVAQIQLHGLADGFTYAEFLASGESLGGAEYA